MRTCQVHRVHLPRVSVPDTHHVWPRGDAGPDIPANRVTCCPTGHRNIHRLLDAYRHAAGDPGWAVRKGYAPAERKLAALGWDRISRKAM